MSNIIDSIQLSGTVYILSAQTSGSGNPTVELTQAEYDALVTAGTVQADTYYIITDAQGGDLSNYMTSAQTMSAINQSVSGKQDTLSAGTGIDITDNVISATGGGGGGSITIDPSLDSGSTNAVANSAITNAINAVSGAIPSTYVSAIKADKDQGYERFYRFSTPSNYSYFLLNNAKINNKAILSTSWGGFDTNFSLVETSAITTSISSSSTDSQVPSAKAVNDKLGGLSVVKLTESEYTALVTKDSNTLYVVVPDPSN